MYPRQDRRSAGGRQRLLLCTRGGVREQYAALRDGSQDTLAAQQLHRFPHRDQRHLSVPGQLTDTGEGLVTADGHAFDTAPQIGNGPVEGGCGTARLVHHRVNYNMLCPFAHLKTVPTLPRGFARGTLHGRGGMLMATTTLDSELRNLEYGAAKEAGTTVDLCRETTFTEVHRRAEGDHPFDREIACLRSQVAHTLMPLRPGDFFAGRLDRMLVGIDPERGGLTEAAYFCRMERLDEIIGNPEAPSELRRQADSLRRYWADRQTSVRCRADFTEQLQQGLPSDDYYGAREIAYPMYGLGGPCLDYGKLVRLGIPGLREEVRGHRMSHTDRESRRFYDCLTAALDILVDAAVGYANQAAQLARAASSDDAVRQRAHRIERSLRTVVKAPPAAYHEAAQLVWLYSLVALPRNYGRMDMYLGGWLAHDLDTGVLSHDEALEMTAGLWRLMVARGDNFNNRVIIGGRGRPNEAAADRFALLALEAQQRVNDIIPQLSLRWYDGMNPAVWRKAMDTIGAGGTFPILYNDDVNVPAVAGAFGVPASEAEQYVMYGCGEYVLDHRSIGSPDAALNVLKALDITLRGGVDSFDGAARGLALPGLREASTFEDVQQAFVRQIEHQVSLLAEAQATIYRVSGEDAAFPFLSLLYDDCIARGKPLLAGGVRYRGGTLEAFGNNSAADALLAVKTAVFDRRLLTAHDLLESLDKDFVGRERERLMLERLPKYGNDDAEADAMSLWVNEVVCRAAMREGARVGLDSFLVVLVNNGDSVLFGKTTGATPDGRRRGEPVSNGNQPGAGRDTSGLTALLNSMAKLDPSLHAGATHNVKLSRATFTTQRVKTEAMLRGYFAAGGTQTMVTVTDRRELERAMEHPEQYANLIVRVGGYSERFVNLPRDIQLEVIRRTLH
ncbi:MAG: hypothetical protein GF331_21990 [Chitinivibrionales bacterium]|nr:hypothetical protein [Chitinivibrionales bacterium]